MQFTDLPVSVQQSIRALAQRAAALGGRLFVFGSFATGQARPNSDLDLGFELPSAVGREDYVRLRRAVADLPTIRPVELVDVRSVSPSFRASA